MTSSLTELSIAFDEGGFSTRIIERGNGERSGAGCTAVLRLNSERELLQELFFRVKSRSRSRPRLL